MNTLTTHIQPNQIWHHYKGYDYRIIAISRCAESLSWYVVYEALYNNDMGQIWHRPLDMFLESVEIDGNIVPRFQKI